MSVSVSVTGAVYVNIAMNGVATLTVYVTLAISAAYSSIFVPHLLLLLLYFCGAAESEWLDEYNILKVNLMRLAQANASRKCKLVNTKTLLVRSDYSVFPVS